MEVQESLKINSEPVIEEFEKEVKDHECEHCNKFKSCGKLFPEAESLNEHINTIHEGHKDFICESCGSIFEEAHTYSPWRAQRL